jgi:hypothetical protein
MQAAERDWNSRYEGYARQRDALRAQYAGLAERPRARRSAVGAIFPGAQRRITRGIARRRRWMMALPHPASHKQ